MPRPSTRIAATVIAAALTVATVTAAPQQAAAPVAGDAAPVSASALAPEPAQPLEPFLARYEVLSGGHALGNATLQVTELAAPRWRVDLSMGGRGLFKLAGINAEQSTVFEDTASGFLPLSQATVRKTLFSRKRTTGSYDWKARQARWTGDIKDWRQRPVPLQPGDMCGLMMILGVFSVGDA